MDGWLEGEIILCSSVVDVDVDVDGCRRGRRKVQRGARVVLRSFPRNEFLVARVVRRPRGPLLLMQYQVRVARCNPNSHLLPQQMEGCWVLQFVLCCSLFEMQEVYGRLCQKIYHYQWVADPAATLFEAAVPGQVAASAS